MGLCSCVTYSECQWLVCVIVRLKMSVKGWSFIIVCLTLSVKGWSFIIVCLTLSVKGWSVLLCVLH